MMGTPVEVPEPRKMNENAAIMRKENLMAEEWKEREFAQEGGWFIMDCLFFGA